MNAELVRGFGVQAQVVHAVIMRETRTRFGAFQLGYLWAILEPALLIGTFYLLFSVAGRVPPSGMSLIGFLATGFIPYTLFRDSVSKCMAAISGNKALLTYPHVHPLDLVIARALLEAGTWLAVFALIMLTDALIIGKLAIHNPLQVLGAVALAVSLGAGLGMIVSSASVFMNSATKLVGPLLRPMFWISGLFFAVNDVPSAARELLLYNPVLHIVELSRGGWYASYEAHYASWWYPLGFVVAFLFAGLTLERMARTRLELT